MEEKFKVPIVLFLFKRKETVIRILDVIRRINPGKLYLLSDGGRNDEELIRVKECREAVDKYLADWDCKIIRRYYSVNKGVYVNIGEGAKWIFSKEKEAIFLEDDNLPDVTFFEYCRRLLDKYRFHDKILWICGTNYLKEYDSVYSYMFTQALLPCGWASWSNKFLKYYDGNLETINSIYDIDALKRKYKNKALFKQQAASIYREYRKKKEGKQFNSWDFQMVYSLKYYNLMGISPKYNLIRNIGVDKYSIHGGNNPKEIMSMRFCEIDTKPILDDWNDPPSISIDSKYEKAIDKIILYPFRRRIITYFLDIIKVCLGICRYDSLSQELRRKINNGNDKK